MKRSSRWPLPLLAVRALVQVQQEMLLHPVVETLQALAEDHQGDDHQHRYAENGPAGREKYPYHNGYEQDGHDQAQQLQRHQRSAQLAPVEP